MAVLWIDGELEDQVMDAEKLRHIRRRLSIESEKLLRSIYSLQKHDFQRLRLIQEAIRAIDRVNALAGKTINEKQAS